MFVVKILASALCSVRGKKLGSMKSGVFARRNSKIVAVKKTSLEVAMKSGVFARRNSKIAVKKKTPAKALFY